MTQPLSFYLNTKSKELIKEFLDSLRSSSEIKIGKRLFFVRNIHQTSNSDGTLFNSNIECLEVLNIRGTTHEKSFQGEADSSVTKPIPMLLICPDCGERHIDVGLWVDKPHHSHACDACGMVWRPAIVPTVGVKFLPGIESC